MGICTESAVYILFRTLEKIHFIQRDHSLLKLHSTFKPNMDPPDRTTITSLATLPSITSLFESILTSAKNRRDSMANHIQPFRWHELWSSIVILCQSRPAWWWPEWWPWLWYYIANRIGSGLSVSATRNHSKAPPLWSALRTDRPLFAFLYWWAKTLWLSKLLFNFFICVEPIVGQPIAFASDPSLKWC